MTRLVQLLSLATSQSRSLHPTSHRISFFVSFVLFVVNPPRRLSRANQTSRHYPLKTGKGLSSQESFMM